MTLSPGARLGPYEIQTAIGAGDIAKEIVEGLSAPHGGA